IISDYFVLLYGTWIPSKTKICIVSIYAPQALSEKRMLWNYISHLLSCWIGECVIMGDFNEVRTESERFGSVFNSQGAAAFNDFISNSGLIDILLEGYSFTWAHPSGNKMSKLDRFLVSDGIVSLFPHTSALCRDKHLSDHRPILLRELISDFGATPFWFFHSWFHWDGFDQMKVKVRWAIEGDENSKFFHGVNNRKRVSLVVRGVMVDGDWVDDPDCIKEEFRSHFAKSFQPPNGYCNRLDFEFPKTLSSEQASDLEIHISKEEIRKAVWACRENKSPGPDGFTFEFFRKFWDTIGPDFSCAVEWFFDHYSF
nr:RNA-directed DNA polymerase, eukaryota [Tanacetum cinerariifolium]